MNQNDMPNNVTHSALPRLHDSLVSAYAKLPLDNRPSALIDLPSYLNIGDSLITLGEFELLKTTHPQLRCWYYGSEPSNDLLMRLNDARGVLLIHGGGNFGSIWPRHQELREHVARTMPNATIVQLPQSVHFDSQDGLRQSLDVLAGHGDFHMMVRDQASYDQLASFPLASLQLLPDSAFALQLHPKQYPTCDLLVLRRQDSESQHGEVIDEVMRNLSGRSVLSGDWADETDLPVRWSKASRLKTRLASRFARRSRNPSLQSFGWYKLSQSRMRLGCHILSQGRVVLTDRLHVHILCTLLGKPHVFFDNNYGKLRGLAEASGTIGLHAVHVTGVEDATEQIDRLLAELGQHPE